jgi:hypothetical protein
VEESAPAPPRRLRDLTPPTTSGTPNPRQRSASPPAAGPWGRPVGAPVPAMRAASARAAVELPSSGSNTPIPPARPACQAHLSGISRPGRILLHMGQGPRPSFTRFPRRYGRPRHTSASSSTSRSTGWLHASASFCTAG